MAQQENNKKVRESKSFWDCKNGLYAGGCRCRVLGGDSICLLELNDDEYVRILKKTISTMNKRELAEMATSSAKGVERLAGPLPGARRTEYDRRRNH